MPVPQEPATIEGSPAVRHGDRSRDVTPQGAVLKMAATIRPKRIPLPNILCLAAQQMERGERARKEAYVPAIAQEPAGEMVVADLDWRKPMIASCHENLRHRSHHLRSASA